MTNILQNVLIIIGFVIVALLGVYLYLEQTNQSLSISAFQAGPTIIDVESQEFLARLQLMQSINLDHQQVFNNTHFMALVQYSRPVIDLPVGRDNPFIPSTDVVDTSLPSN
jgi:hypothetical protein